LESGAVSGKKPSTAWQFAQRFAKALIKAWYFAPTYFWTYEPAKGLSRHFTNLTCSYWMGKKSVLSQRVDRCSLWTAKWGLAADPTQKEWVGSDPRPDCRWQRTTWKVWGEWLLKPGCNHWSTEWSEEPVA
jgi:hypothetical protein